MNPIEYFKTEELRKLARTFIFTLPPAIFIYLFIVTKKYFLLTLISIILLAFILNINEQLWLIFNQKYYNKNINPRILGKKYFRYIFGHKAWLLAVGAAFILYLFCFIVLINNLDNPGVWIFMFLWIFEIFYLITYFVSVAILGKEIIK